MKRTNYCGQWDYNVGALTQMGYDVLVTRVTPDEFKATIGAEMETSILAEEKVIQNSNMKTRSEQMFP